MVEVCNVSYRARGYRNDFSLNNVQFKLEDGYLMCLLGRNGAGKTTLLQTVYGMVWPDGGEIRWQFEGDHTRQVLTKKNLQKFHQLAAYAGGEAWCFEEYSMLQNKELLAALYPQFDEQLYGEYLSFFSLREEEERKHYADLSTGQKMQFQIAFALARKPKLLLLDEPMANLDPVVRTDLLEALQDCVARWNMGIILSTHLVDDISDMADYIGILEQGRLTDFGDREVVLQRYGSENLRNLLLTYGGREEKI